MIRQSSNRDRQVAAMDAKDALVRSLHRAMRGDGAARAAASGLSGQREDLLDHLAGAMCVYAYALRNLGLTFADTIPEVVQTVSVPFAAHQGSALIALARVCCAIVYEVPAADRGGMSQPGAYP
jgi:hypothetical protein